MKKQGQVDRVLNPDDVVCLMAYYAVPDIKNKGGYGTLSISKLDEMGLVNISKIGGEITKKGEAYVEMLLRTPLPVMMYMDPRELTTMPFDIDSEQGL